MQSDDDEIRKDEVKTPIFAKNDAEESEEEEGIEIRRCKKTHLQCGHRCNGALNEMECLPCLEPECAAKCDLRENKDDLCSICYTSELGAQSCVKLTCGHVFHADCVLQLLKHRWSTLKVSFAFMSCPSCKQEISTEI